MVEYQGWLVDPTPDYAVGKYFAHARLVRIRTDAQEEPEMHIERHIGWFDTAEEAIRAAKEWACQWIEDRNAMMLDLPQTRGSKAGKGTRMPSTNRLSWRGHA